ncbi:MAG: TIGR02452 family protein [Oscillospiraceae bacterium]|nr:TIGR02452 family protein [Oscillospiraceae bacterium]
MNYLQIKLENDRIFREGDFPEMRSAVYADLTPKAVTRSGTFRVSEHLLQTDTISAVRQYPDKRVCALNFANANFPGGAYILGGSAQEEALCRASLLYYTIRTAHAYYRRNHLHVLPDYTDSMIYSEHVPVIRDNTGNRLTAPAECDFITCPAVNRTFAKLLMSGKKLDAVMERRITQIIVLAADRSPDVLILGAFGCGVFGNRRETVYPMFEQAINRYLPETVEVVFADPR